MKQTAMTTRFTVIVGAALVALLVAVLALSGGVRAATSPLAVTKTVPGSGAPEISRTANIKAYFNHDMRASTFTSSTFKIRKQGATSWLAATRSVNNTITPTSTNSGSQSVATLDPDADLAANTTYQVVITGGSSGVKDLNGKALSANKSWTFTTVTPPETTIGSGPEGTVASDSTSFTFSSSKPNSTFRCSLDGPTFEACTSPKSYTSLSQGPHTFRVRAIDASGTQDPTPASRSWSVDTIVPAAPAITSPQEDGLVSANFTLSGTAEANATVEVFEGTTSKGTTQANGSGNWSKALSGASEGKHIYTARATDAAGNVSPESNTRTLTVDSTTPDTTIDSGPSGTVSSKSATFTFSSSEANSRFECSLDSSPFSPCPSPAGEPQKANYSSLSEGLHTFQVRAIDAAGNIDLSPASSTWTVDATAPTVISVSPANAATANVTTNVTATFSEAMSSSSISGQSFTLSESGSSVSAQVTYNENSRTATLDPVQALEPSTTYDAKITTSVTDAAGNALVQEKTWSFTTNSGVTVAPTALNLSPTDPLWCSPRQELLTVTNNGPGDVTFAAVSITGQDATYFSSGSQSYLANNGPFAVLAGNYFQDQVTFRPGSTASDRNRDYRATLTYKDGTGATIGTPVSLTASVHCLNFP